ncbi:hypothetical protein CCH79_00018882, partial [Gambusia affinis]
WPQFFAVVPPTYGNKLICQQVFNCVMSPFLYSLFTYDCRPVHGSNDIIKFADDTTVIGLIRDDEAAYREEVDRGTLSYIHIKGTVVERVDTFKFLGVHISEDLTWTTSCSKLIKKAHQRLFFMRTLRKNHLSSEILTNFYRCTIESILTNCITELLCLQPEGAAEGGENCPVYRWGTAPCHQGYLQEAVFEKGRENHKGLHSPSTNTLFPPALWEALQKPTDQNHRAPEQLLSHSCHAFERLLT